MNNYIPKVYLKYESIPSKGLLYPKKGNIYYTPFTFGEIFQYSQSILNPKAKNEFILNKITTENFDKLDLTYADFCYIGLLINLSTFGATSLKLEFQCSECEEESSIVLNMATDIKFDELEAGKSKATLSLFNKKLIFTPITIRDYFKLIELGKHNNENYLFAIQCRNEDLELESLVSYISNPMLNDISKIEKVDKVFYHGIEPITFKCPKCNAENIKQIDGGIETYVSPFCESDHTIENEVVFS
jgi:transcription elongation factor Elf1